MLKSLARRILRNTKVRRVLPNNIPIYVSPDSQLKYLKRSFDIDLYEMSNRFIDQQSVVWDVGANCGTMAFNAAKASQIVAVEADPFLANLLQESTILNGVDVKIVAAAAFSSISLAEFSIAKHGRASNHLTTAGGRSQTGGERGRITVPTLPLDFLLDHFRPPTFIKIDVEGAEIDVLKGASRILREVRPIVYYEAEQSTNEECLSILGAAGYHIEKGAELNWLARPQ